MPLSFLSSLPPVLWATLITGSPLTSHVRMTGTSVDSPPFSIGYGTIGGLSKAYTDSHRQILMIRVSQETSPGAGDFDKNIVGFVRALQTTGIASDFYQYQRISNNYGNTEPVLAANTSHLFFVNATDGLALFVVHGATNKGSEGAAVTQFELSGGTASILLSDDETEAISSGGGTVFTGRMDWPDNYTDGMVVGALPVGFTILGQFLQPPYGLNAWEVISADGSTLPLRLVPGQRVRLDVALHVKVRQDH